MEKKLVIHANRVGKEISAVRRKRRQAIKAEEEEVEGSFFSRSTFSSSFTFINDY